MPQLDFDVKFKSDQAQSFPRLKLEKDERARAYAGLEKPTYSYVHNLRAPKIVNGKPEYAEVKGRSELLKDFLSRPFCFGDDGIMRDKGADPRNCIMCRASTQSDQVDPAQRRWAMHVIKYSTKPGSFDLARPASCQLLIWGFTDMAYNQLVDIAKEWAVEGRSGLLSHDLLLGPCESKEWQKFKIAPGATTAFAADDALKTMVIETYRENRVKADLETFCGRKVGQQWVEADLERIAAAWRIVNGAPPSDKTERAEERSLTDGLSGLLSDTAQPAAAQPVDLGSLIPAQRTEDGPVLSFEDLVKDDNVDTKDKPNDEFDKLLAGL